MYSGVDRHRQDPNRIPVSSHPGVPVQTGPRQDGTFLRSRDSLSYLGRASSDRGEAHSARRDSLDKVAPSFPIAVETFRLMGELLALYAELKESLKELDEEQAGQTDLQKIQHLLSQMGGCRAQRLLLASLPVRPSRSLPGLNSWLLEASCPETLRTAESVLSHPGLSSSSLWGPDEWEEMEAGGLMERILVPSPRLPRRSCRRFGVQGSGNGRKDVGVGMSHLPIHNFGPRSISDFSSGPGSQSPVECGAVSGCHRGCSSHLLAEVSGGGSATQ